MEKNGVNRREFLQTGRAAVAGGVAATLVAGLSNSTWAKALGAIGDADAAVLLRMCRVLYPHDALSDDYYAACVESLDAKAHADAALATSLREGVAALNEATGGFLERSEKEQVAALTAIESSPFFQAVRGHMVVALYNDRKVWNHFGYEGPSFPFGGYLERGFNDIDWLGE